MNPIENVPSTSTALHREIAPGVWHFATPPFNWYVLQQDNRITVVDCGFPGHYAALQHGLAHLKLGVRDVAAIVVTHAHADHLGFATRLSRESGAPIFLHREDQAAARRILSLPWPGLLANARRSWGRHILTSAVRAGILQLTRVTEAQPLRDGDVLDIPGRPCVLALPGHTRGHVGLWCEQARTLLAGDALMTQDLLTGTGAAPQLGPASLTWDLSVADRSLDKVRDLGEITLATGHGPVWRGHSSLAVDIARENLRR